MRKVIVKETRTDVLTIDDLVPVRCAGSVDVKFCETNDEIGTIESRLHGNLINIGIWLPYWNRGSAKWEVVTDDNGQQCLVLVKEGR